MLDTEGFTLLYVAILLLFAEGILNVMIVHYRSYTEIDWVAYMQEVEPVIKNGSYDYYDLKGDTGPLVYPAGFVWVFSAFYLATDQGTDIQRAQHIYVMLYLLMLTLVFCILMKTRKLPPFVLVLMSVTAYRIHSIFVLRLFNDPVAMIFLYSAINLFIHDKWSLGSIFYSLAVSVKMNILYFAPALYLAYVATQGIWGTIKQLSICASVQVILAIPFLLENPKAYIMRSFDLGRVFLYEWTVNWRFLPEDIFVNKWFHISLLLLHFIVLLLALPKWWKMLTTYQTLKKYENCGPTTASHLLVQPLFMSNFIGVVFSRSLHYQFYVWYFHQIPYLLYCTKLPVIVKLVIMGVIEYCWNTYPSTNLSSGLLHCCHLILLTGLFTSMYNINVSLVSAGENNSKKSNKKKAQ